MVKGGLADQPELTDEQVAAAFAKLPKECKTYLKFIEKFLNVKIKFVSVGAERNANVKV